MGERTRYEPGTFCWVGLATSDVAAAKGFYTRLFGWQEEDLDAGVAGVFTASSRRARAAGAPPHWTSYISVEDAGRLNGGMRGQTEQDRRAVPAWLPYFTVECADDAARQAVRLGGRVLLATAESPRGRFGVIADPQTAALAVLEGETDP